MCMPCRYGTGRRIKLKFTRAIIDAIHSGELAGVDVSTTPIFNLQVRACSYHYHVPSMPCAEIRGWQAL